MNLVVVVGDEPAFEARVPEIVHVCVYAYVCVCVCVCVCVIYNDTCSQLSKHESVKGHTCTHTHSYM